MPRLVVALVAFFEEQEAEMLRRVEEERTKPRSTDRSIKGIDVSLTDFAAIFKDFLSPVVAEIVLEGFESGALRLGNIRGGELFFDNDIVRDAITEQVLRSSLIQGTTEAELQAALDAIQSGLTEEQSYEEIQAAVRRVFRNAKRGRAEMIAQTAAVAGYETGQQRAFEEAGIGTKKWLSRRDSRVRGRDTNSGHWEADGQVVAVTSKFRVRPNEKLPYEKLSHPGDPAGSAANVVRCRCTSLPGD